MKKIYLLLTLILIVAFASAQTTLEKGLMAYYPFSGNSKDSSGNGNNPSFNNATLTTDRFGNANSAYSFNGSSSYIQIPGSPSLNTGPAVSLSLWVKPNGFYTGTCGGNYLLCKGLESETGYGAVFSATAYDNKLGINQCNYPADTAHEFFFGMLTAGSPNLFIHSGSWYHVVYTNDGDTSKLYVNDSLISANFAKIKFNTNDIYLGRYFSIASTPYWFNGVLDDIRIYNRALSVTEVNTLYIAPNPSSKDTIPTCDSSLVMVGSPTNKAFQTSSFLNDPNAGPRGDTAGTELYAFAWTASSIGIPNYNGRSLIKYDVSQLPTNAIVKSAKLYLYSKLKNLNGISGSPTYGTNNIGLLQKVYSHWKMDSTNYFTPLVVDTATEVVLPQSTNTSQDYVADITAYTQSWVNKPDSNYGMLFRLQTENDPYNSLVFESGLASDTTKRPRLEICYSVPANLSVAVKSFTANAITYRYAGIQFSTTNETNTIAIEIDRSFDSTNFAPINLLSAKGSAGLNQYTLSDKVKNGATKVYYRLKLVNKDGSTQTSKIIGVPLATNNNQYSIYPNPARKFIMINGNNVKEVDILDTKGKLMYAKKSINSASSLNKVKINLSPGNYIVQLQITDGTLVNEKIVVE